MDDITDLCEFIRLVAKRPSVGLEDRLDLIYAEKCIKLDLRIINEESYGWRD